jgi:hypothetical protein
MLLADGFDDAFIGVGRRCGQPTLAVYSIDKCIDILVEAGSTPDEAQEYLEYSSIGSWAGEATPIWVETTSLKEYLELLPDKEEKDADD